MIDMDWRKIMTAQNPAQSPAVSTLPERNVLVAFAFFILVAGGASVAIRITYAELAPFWAATARFGLGALVFWGIVAYKKMPLPKGRALLGAVLFGALTVGFAFLLNAWALVVIPASLYQILMAMVPLLTLFLSSFQGLESITRRGILGAALAVTGIAVSVGGTSSSAFSLPHIAAVLVAAAFMAEGGVLIKKFPPNPPVMTNAIGMTTGAVILGLASLISGEQWTVPTQVNTIAAFLYLVFFVTILAFLLYMFVLGRWTASGTSYGFVVIPLVTISVAATLAGEKITLNFLVGSLLVLAGVYVGALMPSKTKPAAVEECKDRSGQVLPRCM
jgi:drug/metabolite transporter (DMT)-like permease